MKPKYSIGEKVYIKQQYVPKDNPTLWEITDIEWDPDPMDPTFYYEIKGRISTDCFPERFFISQKEVIEAML